MKKTLVLGASPNAYRISYAAVLQLEDSGHEVIAVGAREGHIGDTPIHTGAPQAEGVHTVTLYLNPSLQKPLYDYIFGLQPQRIIFNPGTENPELMRMARERGIEPVAACTLVLLAIGTY